MEFSNQPGSRKAIDEVLMLDEDPVTKVQQIIDLGFEEEVANAAVERYQIGQQSAVYYEQLPLGRFEDL